MANYKDKSQRSCSAYEHGKLMCCLAAKEWVAESSGTTNSGYRVTQ